MRLPFAKAATDGDFRPGQRVKVVQRGSLKIGRLVLEDNTFIGVTIARRNADGSYQVTGMVKTPETDEVTVPAEWIEPI
jgi:hypothetical protein